MKIIWPILVAKTRIQIMNYYLFILSNYFSRTTFYFISLFYFIKERNTKDDSESFVLMEDNMGTEVLSWVILLLLLLFYSCRFFSFLGSFTSLKR